MPNPCNRDLGVVSLVSSLQVRGAVGMGIYIVELQSRSGGARSYRAIAWLSVVFKILELGVVTRGRRWGCGW